eukprot:jgi/Botrbrau1/7331/Bobra.247_3s0026.1
MAGPDFSFQSRSVNNTAATAKLVKSKANLHALASRRSLNPLADLFCYCNRFILSSIANISDCSTSQLDPYLKEGLQALCGVLHWVVLGFRVAPSFLDVLAALYRLCRNDGLWDPYIICF